MAAQPFLDKTMFGIFSSFKWSMQLAAWATPHIRAWSLERSLCRMEAERHLQARNYGEAEKYLVEAVAEADVQHHSVRRIQFRLQLAEAQRKQGKLSEAEQTVRSALDLTVRVSNPSGYVQCLDALAEVFHDAENYPAMEAALQQALRTEAAMPHPDPLRMARRVHRLGTARHKNGRSDEAIPALEKAVKLHEDGYGAEHLETANLLSELGSIYRAQGNHEEAQQCLRRALRIHENALGYESEEALHDLHHLAGSLEESGDVESAANQYERLLQLKLLVVGGDLDELAEMQFGLAGIYIGWSNYARARELLSEAIGKFKSRKDARLAMAHETMAHVEECSGRYQEAVAALALAEKVWELCGAARMAELVDNMAHRAELLDRLRQKSEASWLRGRIAELTGMSVKAHTA
jgi:eukaryotic-like serine/threonine-protein kinase